MRIVGWNRDKYNFERKCIMEFTFEKVQRIEDANIYRVSNITDIYETDLFDDYNRNVDNLSLLVQERINQFIVHVDKSEEKNVKKKNRV